VPEESADDAPHHLSVQFDFETERRARIVERSVRVEVGEIDDARSAARVERASAPDATNGDGEGRTVCVGIEAADLVALRAGTNTWIRLLDVADRVGDVAARSRDGT
jgi:KEOPS complex subunit Pcc1